MRTLILSLVVAFAVSAVAFGMPGKPDFAPHIYADGTAWGTKVTTELPSPMANNMKSYDKLFVITNSNNPEPQLPVGEAAPGNPMYNGGRWYTHTVEWTPEGLAHHGVVPVLMSYDDVMFHYNLGHLTITPGSFPGGPPEFFSCPLLPVK
jgi:hypothetical protein